MDLTELKDKIVKAFKGKKSELNKVLSLVDEDQAIFPFNEYEHLICGLIDTGGLSYRQYLDIRSEYNSQNPNLWIFELSAPRGFGEQFAQTFVQSKCSKLKKASRKLDSTFGNLYDLWLDGITIEVKASRVVDSDSTEPLYKKALSRNSDKNSLMNFQQLKPQLCDVFIWVAVFRDEIVLWVMSSKEIIDHALFSKGQHRGNKGNEGQLHVNQNNIHQFDKYILKKDNLEKAIRNAAKRN